MSLSMKPDKETYSPFAYEDDSDTDSPEQTQMDAQATAEMMAPEPLVFIVGPPKAGKSTVADILQNQYGYFVVQTVDKAPPELSFDPERIYDTPIAFDAVESFEQLRYFRQFFDMGGITLSVNAGTLTRKERFVETFQDVISDREFTKDKFDQLNHRYFQNDIGDVFEHGDVLVDTEESMDHVEQQVDEFDRMVYDLMSFDSTDENDGGIKTLGD